MPRRRSYDQYCSAARALDSVGDRWTLLIVRELLAGPRRYTDLHADLPGVSTDVLASRLRDLERDDLVTRRRLPPPAAASVYELTTRGSALLPVLDALSAWGAPDLGEPRPTDAVRAHWLALPVLRILGERAGAATGTVEVRLDSGAFHVRVGSVDRARGADAGQEPAETAYGEGGAPTVPDAVLALDTATCQSLAGGALSLTDALLAGTATVEGGGPLAKTLRGE